MANIPLTSSEMLEVLDQRIHDAGRTQTMRRGCAPEKKPRTWEEIEAYSEWIASIRVREALVSLRTEVAGE